ncbi:MAG: CBS domain-containing protein [Hyphomicrobiales bacterium]|nr:CBS domain-containing protein [Hyphomicrobiales bacterium]
MNAGDVMTQSTVTIGPDDSVMHAVELMLKRRISGLPVVDDTGALVGILTEGDLLRRIELGTQKRRPRWIEFLIGPGRLASEYVSASGRKVHEVMTSSVHTVSEDTPLTDVVSIMESRQVKRLPVVRGSKLVGILSRANLLRALVSISRDTKPTNVTDACIRKQLLEELGKQSWAPLALIDVIVKNGVVHLWGTLTEERQRQGIRVVAENTPGVTRVVDHLVWIEPVSGLVVPSTEDFKPIGQAS